MADATDKMREALEQIAGMSKEMEHDLFSATQVARAALAQQPEQAIHNDYLEYLLNICRANPNMGNKEIILAARQVFADPSDPEVVMETCGDCDPCIGGRPDQCAVGGYPVLREQPAQGEAVAYEIELRQLRARAEAAEAAIENLGVTPEQAAAGLARFKAREARIAELEARYAALCEQEPVMFYGKCDQPLIPRPSMEGKP